jgi:hypothetical protein
MVVSDFGIFWPSSTYQGSIEKLRRTPNIGGEN